MYLANEDLTGRHVKDSSRRSMVTSSLPLKSYFNCTNDSLQSHNLITSFRQSLIAENSIDFLFLYRPLWNCYQLRNESIIFFWVNTSFSFCIADPFIFFSSFAHVCFQTALLGLKPQWRIFLQVLPSYM